MGARVYKPCDCVLVFHCLLSLLNDVGVYDGGRTIHFHYLLIYISDHMCETEEGMRNINHWSITADRVIKVKLWTDIWIMSKCRR